MKKLLLFISLFLISTQSLARGGGYGRFARFFEDKIPPEVIEFLSPIGAIFTPTVFYIIIFLIILAALLYVLWGIYENTHYLITIKQPIVAKNRGPNYKPKMMTSEEFDEEEDDSKPVIFLRTIYAIALACFTGWVLNYWIGLWDSFPSSW